MKHHMSCGCVIDKPARTKTNKRTCPDHPGAHVVERSMVCEDCGKWFKIPSQGGGFKRCKPCSKIKNKENTKKTNAAKKINKKYEQKITLVFKCGCRYRADTFRPGGIRMCPKHQKRVKYRVSTCVQCGHEFQAKNLIGKVQLQCQACLDKPLAANTPVKKKDAALESELRYDCANRSECLCHHWHDKPLPCAGCKKYVPKAIKPVQRSKHDPYEWAHGVAA